MISSVVTHRSSAVSSKRQFVLGEWIAPGRYLLAWVPAAITALYAKWVVMASGGDRIAAFLNHQKELDIWLALSVFRLDFPITAGLIPLLLLFMLKPLPRAVRASATALITSLTILVFFAETVTLYAVGRFLSPELYRDAVFWGLQDTSAIKDFIHWRSFARLAAALLFALAATAYACYKDRGSEGPRYSTALAAMPAFVFALLVSTCGVLWIPRPETMSYHQDIYSKALTSLFDANETSKSKFAGMSLPKMRNRFRAATHTPVASKANPYWGRAPQADVLLFVLETANAQALPIDGPLDDMPALRRLRELSFVAHWIAS
jgi:hypothetical protein